jgi:hypothetical protein
MDTNNDFKCQSKNATESAEETKGKIVSSPKFDSQRNTLV